MCSLIILTVRGAGRSRAVRSKANHRSPSTVARLIDEMRGAKWRPPSPGGSSCLVCMLMQGFSRSYWSEALGCSTTTVSKWRARARAAAVLNPELQRAATEAMCALSPADGMYMARIRGRAQMPYWSRVAVVEYRKRGYGLAEIARAFRCATRTITNIIRRTSFLMPDRVLTQYQESPPARRASNGATYLLPSQTPTSASV
jgi:hypothetical protein